ncbi:MAG: DNA-3-methyladenine glycosylase I [Chloroflexota bacterium]|nr:DNA-3-methyladenine glycosylase I [Chloroflexota bacterium]
MTVYHDEEWGVPCNEDQALFERLQLEGFRAGLSWLTILRKRPNFQHAFDNWDAEHIAAYGPDDVARLLADPGIIRNRLKINGAINNARAYLRVRDELGSFNKYIWSFVGGEPLTKPGPATSVEVPVSTPESDAMAKDLKRRGFVFVGPTICYAFMQSVGLVNDHEAACFLATN